MCACVRVYAYVQVCIRVYMADVRTRVYVSGVCLWHTQPFETSTVLLA
jgi:hypothetical protein